MLELKASSGPARPVQIAAIICQDRSHRVHVVARDLSRYIYKSSTIPWHIAASPANCSVVPSHSAKFAWVIFDTERCIEPECSRYECRWAGLAEGCSVLRNRWGDGGTRLPSGRVTVFPPTTRCSGNRQSVRTVLAREASGHIRYRKSPRPFRVR